MKINEINKLSSDQLKNKIHSYKKDLFNIRFKKANGQLEDTSKARGIKRTVAKLYTKLLKKK